MKAFLLLACVIGLTVAAPMMPYPQLPVFGFPNVISAEIVLPQIFPQLPSASAFGSSQLGADVPGPDGA
ncbi:hypothetical protein MHYP_G00089330 [Metynnis hypsauchen]